MHVYIKFYVLIKKKTCITMSLVTVGLALQDDAPFFKNMFLRFHFGVCMFCKFWSVYARNSLISNMCYLMSS